MKTSKKILIIGLTERMGGVETFIYNTTIFSNKTKYTYDYLIHGTDHCVFEKEIRDFYSDGEQHFFFVRKYKEDPIGCLKDLHTFYKNNGKKYDWIHFQSGSAAEILYVFPFCLKYKIPVISHSHNGNGYNPIVNRLFRFIVNMVTKKRLACSEVAADWLFGKKHARDTAIIINGIDTNRFTYNPDARKTIRELYGIADNQLLIGHIGRFSEQKNHSFIIDIFLEIKKRRADAILLLVGVGELLDEVKQKVKDLELCTSVIFAGKQKRTEDYYSAFDAFLMPSLYEGLPIVGVEAQCEGLDSFFSDTIDKQILITKRAHMLSLIKGPSEWARYILSRMDTISRDLSASEIYKQGYSIQSTLSTLQKVYEIED